MALKEKLNKAGMEIDEATFVPYVVSDGIRYDIE